MEVIWQEQPGPGWARGQAAEAGREPGGTLAVLFGAPRAHWPRDQLGGMALGSKKRAPFVQFLRLGTQAGR